MSVQATAKLKKDSFTTKTEGIHNKQPDKISNTKYGISEQEDVAIEINPIIVVIFLLLLVTGGWYLWNRLQNNNPTDTNLFVTVNANEGNIKGSADAEYAFIEYSDYECPYCKQHATGYDLATGTILKSVEKQVEEEYIDTNKVKYVYKPLALVPNHNTAFNNEYIASVCAGKQNKFWEYHATMFQKSQGNGLGIDGKMAQDSSLIAEADNLQLNTEDFKKCLAEKDTSLLTSVYKEYSSAIKPVYEEKKMIDYLGTPLFVICKISNKETGECTGEAFAGALPFSEMKVIIDEFISAQK